MAAGVAGAGAADSFAICVSHALAASAGVMLDNFLWHSSLQQAYSLPSYENVLVSAFGTKTLPQPQTAAAFANLCPIAIPAALASGDFESAFAAPVAPANAELIANHTLTREGLNLQSLLASARALDPKGGWALRSTAGALGALGWNDEARSALAAWEALVRTR